MHKNTNRCGKHKVMLMSGPAGHALHVWLAGKKSY